MKPETTLFCLALSLIAIVAMTIIMVKHARHSVKVAAKKDTFLYCTGHACCMFMVAGFGALYFCKNNIPNEVFALVMAATIIYGAIMGSYCTKQLPKTAKQAQKRLKSQALKYANR